MRPPASPSIGSIYEPEAVGDIGAYAPEGRRKSKAKGIEGGLNGKR